MTETPCKQIQDLASQSLLLLLSFFLDLKNRRNWQECQVSIGKLEKEKLSRLHSVVKFCSCSFPGVKDGCEDGEEQCGPLKGKTNQAKTCQNFRSITAIQVVVLFKQINTFAINAFFCILRPHVASKLIKLV